MTDEEIQALKRERFREWHKRKFVDPEWRAKYNAKQRARYAANPDPQKARSKRARQAVLYGPETLREAARQQMAKWRAGKRAQNPDYFRDALLRKKYGIGFADLQAMLAAQHFRCAVCGESIDEITRRLDHDHSTGEIRGLLCHHCNVLLGHCGDSSVVLRAAIRYLEAFALKRAKVRK